MKTLLIYPNRGPRGNTPISLAMASAALKSQGHEVQLFDTTFYEQEEKSEKEIGEELLDFKPVDLTQAGVVKRKGNPKLELEKMVQDYSPDLIAFSFLSTHLIGEEEYDMCSRGLNLIEGVDLRDVPVLVGGLHPTFSPEEIIRNDNVDIISRGESEGALIELANRMQEGKDITDVKNLWIKINGDVHKNPPRPIISDLDTLPFIDYSIYDEKSFFRPFDGKVVRGVDWEISRGCPYGCTYCLTPPLKKIYRGQRYHREKSIDRIVKEAEKIKLDHNIDFIKFHDEDFLAIRTDKLRELSKKFASRVEVKFAVEIRPESVTEEKAELLREMGCEAASVGVECGNEEYRRRFLNRNMSNEQIINAAKYLRDVGIRARSFNMIGLPFETREMVLETIELNRVAGFNSCGVSYFSPFRGTELRRLCLEEGFVPQEEDLKFTREGSILTMPHPYLSSNEINGLMKSFNFYVYLPPEFMQSIRRYEKGVATKEEVSLMRKEYRKIRGI